MAPLQPLDGASRSALYLINLNIYSLFYLSEKIGDVRAFD